MFVGQVMGVVFPKHKFTPVPTIGYVRGWHNAEKPVIATKQQIAIILVILVFFIFFSLIVDEYNGEKKFRFYLFNSILLIEIPLSDFNCRKYMPLLLPDKSMVLTLTS